MLRRLSATALVSLTLVPAALADGAGPNPGLMQGWTGITGPGLPVRYVTLPAGKTTVLASISRSSGRVLGWDSLPGLWGVPLVANDGTPGGLSRSGRLLVLADWNPSRHSPLRSISRFELVSTKSLRVWRTITLQGDFAFDALSPGGGTLYLIQHVSTSDLTRYLVRAYDIGAGRLLPAAIADRRQAGWVMQGSPVTRVASTSGQWVYTLYQQAGGYPFVHALDALHRTAVCIGIPWKGNQDALPGVKLRLNERAGKLNLVDQQDRTLFAVDTKTFWVSAPGAKNEPSRIASR